jgi:hypothetical protein
LKWLLQQRLQSFHPLRKISTVPVLLLLLGGWTTYDAKLLDGLARFLSVDYNDRKEKILPRNDLKRCFAKRLPMTRPFRYCRYSPELEHAVRHATRSPTAGSIQQRAQGTQQPARAIPSQRDQLEDGLFDELKASFTVPALPP